jgi:hypothetical protein
MNRPKSTAKSSSTRFGALARGKLMLLAIFTTSIAAGAGIGLVLRLFGWS